MSEEMRGWVEQFGQIDRSDMVAAPEFAGPPSLVAMEDSWNAVEVEPTTP